MLFSSLVFLLFFLPLFFLCYFLVRKRAARNAVLFGFSLFFYAWGEPLYLLLMLFSLTVNWAFALRIDAHREKAKAILTLDVIVNLALIGVFKYAGFLVGTVNLIPGLSLPVPEIALPIGISFYTFQILSYVVDVYRGDCQAQRNYMKLGAYLCAFPQLIAGPIVRYVTVAEELDNRRETVEDVTAGIRRFLSGLGKKVLIANAAAELTDALLGAGVSEIGAAGAWMAAVGYTIQIYYDFSGYSDMAIGLGRMMGFHYLENFGDPYAAVSVTDFWRRWHISLSSFFRDYVYIPLGGNRVSKPRWAMNLLIVWMLTGLWHGSSWNFVLWGLYYGVLLLSEKLFWGDKLAKIPVLRRIYTLFCVVIGWVIFRAETLGEIGQWLGGLFGRYGGACPAFVLQDCGLDPLMLLAMAAGIVLAFPLEKKIAARLQLGGKGAAIGGILLDIGSVAVFLCCLISLEVGSYNPFIYFRF